MRWGLLPAGTKRSELQQFADLYAAVGGQPVCPLEGGIHAGKIHDVEGLNLPLALGERSALHRPAERVPSYRGLNQTSAGRGRSERSVEHERAVGFHLLVKIGPGLEVGLVAAGRIRIGSHQHQIAHALTVSPRSDIDPGRRLRRLPRRGPQQIPLCPCCSDGPACNDGDRASPISKVDHAA
jgi:hypothetical protein